MEFVAYFAKFVQLLVKRQPNEKQATIKDYLDTFAALPPLFVRSEKCASTAEIFRVKGNNMFVTGSYKHATVLYTCSISNAPPYSQCIALAYANRSAALYHLEAYQECILDIDRALDLPYPDDLRNKIILRKESAMTNLNSAAAHRSTNNGTVVEDLKYTHGKNAKIPGADNGIGIKYSPQDGWKLFAKMSFKAGDVLVVEKPFASVLSSDEAAAYCHYCLKESWCLVPCDKCTYEIYCSEKCRAEAYESYHRVECGIQHTLMSIFPFATAWQVYVLRCLNILSKQGTDLIALDDDLREAEPISEPGQRGFTEEGFFENQKNVLLSLLAGQETEGECKSQIFLNATCIVILLRNYTNFFKTNAEVPIVAKLLAKLISLLKPYHRPILKFGTTDFKAHALYPVIDLASHACINNTVRYIDTNDRMVLRASQTIQSGEQILINSCGVIFNSIEINTRSVRLFQGKYVCQKCDKTLMFPLTRYPRIKIHRKLRAKMQKKPCDIEGLWQLLKLMNEKLQPSSWQTLKIKSLISDAYEGHCDPDEVTACLQELGIP